MTDFITCSFIMYKHSYTINCRRIHKLNKMQCRSRENPLTLCKSLTNFITCSFIKYKHSYMINCSRNYPHIFMFLLINWIKCNVNSICLHTYMNTRVSTGILLYQVQTWLYDQCSRNDPHVFMFLLIQCPLHFFIYTHEHLSKYIERLIYLYIYIESQFEHFS